MVPDDGGDDAPAEVDEVVVTGSRAPGRSRLETVAPVDVVTAEALAEQGTTELAEALSVTTPSVNFPRPAITDATDVIRPATLRGLAPDQTLVLVNSARRHQTALVNVNGSIGRGSAAVDLNAIPTSAIDRVEVLREGASALYGFDAIAGVINIRLREERSGGGVTATVGQYRTTVDTFRIPEGPEENDGTTVTVSGWQGLPLGADGFVTVSAEYRDREPTSRGDLDVRVNRRQRRGLLPVLALRVQRPLLLRPAELRLVTKVGPSGGASIGAQCEHRHCPRPRYSVAV